MEEMRCGLSPERRQGLFTVDCGPSGAFIRRPEKHASQVNGTMATMRLKADCMKNPKENEDPSQVESVCVFVCVCVCEG